MRNASVAVEYIATMHTHLSKSQEQSLSFKQDIYIIKHNMFMFKCIYALRRPTHFHKPMILKMLISVMCQGWSCSMVKTSAVIEGL